MAENPIDNDFEIDPDLSTACEVVGPTGSLDEMSQLILREISLCLQINTTLQRRILVALEDIHKQLEGEE